VTEERARELADQRAERRAAGDFAAADALRASIEALGFSVADGPDGFRLVRSAAPGPAARVQPQQVASRLAEPADADVTVHWLDEGWTEDVLRGIAAFRAHEGARSVQHVVVEAVESDAGWPEDVDVVRLVPGAGWARARNAGLERTRGRLVLVVDGSTEVTGDVLGPLEAALADPAVGIAGPVGAVVTEGMHEFVPAEGEDCDAIEGYLLAFRRELLEGGLRFEPRFRFYRTADLDLSFQVLELGLRARVVDVPIERHEHRMWWATDPEDRRRWSKRNYYRFLDRWRGREDLTVEGRGEGGTPG
jgi:cysteinyl-tRNA synthetase